MQAVRLVVKPFKIPKYYKVFINKKKYKARARASVLFLFIQNTNNKSKKNKKVNFWRNYLSAFLRGKPLFSFEKIPQVQKRAEKERKRGIHVLSPNFNIQRKTKRPVFVKYPLKSILSPFKRF